MMGDEIDDPCDSDEYDDEDADLDECSLMADGQCMAAGSEWCDFQCPMRDSEYFAGSRAWNKKHGIKR